MDGLAFSFLYFLKMSADVLTTQVASLAQALRTFPYDWSQNSTHRMAPLFSFEVSHQEYRRLARPFQPLRLFFGYCCGSPHCPSPHSCLSHLEDVSDQRELALRQLKAKEKIERIELHL